ncbi:MAG TPA: excinuclease ABC subunit C [Elusimicrobia bacterium]|jgi:putative endonuclease|nr:excinuclease ABC subunit C [Elusimicrobiota bacterium]
MSGFVYILKSERNGRYYIGSTNNLARRIDEHKIGKVIATKHLLPLQLMFFQRFESLSQARRVEYGLKKLKRRDIIENIIEEKRIKIARE